MKKAIKKYLTQLHENEEKGFSLVELIIVMAIMAILVGVVASQVIPYMEKSRQSKDQQQLSGLVTDITASLASSAVSAQNVAACELNETALKNMAADPTNDGPKIVEEFNSLRNATSCGAAITGVKDKLKSKAAANGSKKVFMSYDVTKSELTIYMTKNGQVSGDKINKLTVVSE